MEVEIGVVYTTPHRDALRGRGRGKEEGYVLCLGWGRRCRIR